MFIHKGGMMKSTLLAVTAIFFYAIHATIIEHKLAQVSPITNMIFSYIGILAFAIPIFLFSNQLGINSVMPQTNQYWIILLCGVILFIGNFCYFSAYNSGGSLMTITTITILMPVFASLIKFAIGGGTPTTTQLVGYLFAATAVFLISK